MTFLSLMCKGGGELIKLDVTVISEEVKGV